MECSEGGVSTAEIAGTHFLRGNFEFAHEEAVVIALLVEAAFLGNFGNGEF